MGECFCLIVPALFCETAAVQENDSAFALPVFESVNNAAVFGRKRNRFGGLCDCGNQDYGEGQPPSNA
jgi:hypothetical protein